MQLRTAVKAAVVGVATLAATTVGTVVHSTPATAVNRTTTPVNHTRAVRPSPAVRLPTAPRTATTVQAATAVTTVTPVPPVVSSPTQPAVAVYGSSAWGSKQELWAVVPKGTTTNRMAVILIHGGGWAGNDHHDMDPYMQRLYAAGIPSFSINYRLAQDAPWPAQRDDVLAAVSYVRAHAGPYGINPARIALIGSSAGGHLGLIAASFGEGGTKIRAVVSYSAPGDIQVTRDLADQGPDQAWLADVTKQLLPTEQDYCGPLCRSASAPFTASKGDTPTLLFHSAEEWVGVESAVKYKSAYTKYAPNVPVTFVELPGTRHANAYGYTDTAVWDQTMAWLTTYDGATVAPAAMHGETLRCVAVAAYRTVCSWPITAPAGSHYRLQGYRVDLGYAHRRGDVVTAVGVNKVTLGPDARAYTWAYRLRMENGAVAGPWSGWVRVTTHG